MSGALLQASMFARVSPLGLRFWDTVLSKPVGDGLVVTAWPVGVPGRRVQASANPSGTWFFHELPGLGDFGRGAGDAAFWANAPAPRDYVVEVEDAARRFSAFRINVKAPVQGSYEFECDPAPALGEMPKGHVPLLPAPTRVVPEGMAAIRAELWDPNRKAPAARAVLVVRQNAANGKVLGRGIADEKGRVVVMFPYPAVPPVGPGNPAVPLGMRTWNVHIGVRYDDAVSGAGEVPGLGAVLAQKKGRIWADAAMTEEVGVEKMGFGERLTRGTLGVMNGSSYVTA